MTFDIGENSDTAQLDRFVARIEREGWSVPCVFLLHMIEPFETVAGQILLLLKPLVSGADDLANIVQNHAQMEYLRQELARHSKDRRARDPAEE